MKKESLFSRYNLLWTIILCYLTPLLGLSIYGTLIPRESGDWNILSLGFFITSCGSLALFWMMTRWENSLSNQHPNAFTANDEFNNDNETIQPSEQKTAISFEDYDLAKRSLAEAQQTQIRLLTEIDALTETLNQQKLNKEQTSNQADKIQSELEQTKRKARQELEQQQNYIRELQEALADQKNLSEKKQQQMLQLETKVGDLTYEIKTLLQFAEAHSGSLLSHEAPEEKLEILSSQPKPSEPYKDEFIFSENPTQTSHEASQELKHCLDIAQKIKGSQRFGSQIYSFLDSPADSFSIDLRRLCDRLRSETHSVVLLYSPKDNHLLFASNQIKTLTGWSPEKFIQNFNEILLEESEWKQGVNSLAMRSEAQIQIRLRTKSGPSLVANANLGMIPTGIFRNHTIAVLYTNLPAGALQH